MEHRALGQVARCAVAGLSFVAASYHLTELAHEQAELARQRRELAQKRLADRESDEQRGKPESKPILEWRAPDILDRVGTGAVELEPSARLSSHGAPAILAGSGVDGDRFPTLGAPNAPRLKGSPRGTLVRLSDRSSQGPPIAA